jgi:hypothetical protein
MVRLARSCEASASNIVRARTSTRSSVTNWNLMNAQLGKCKIDFAYFIARSVQFPCFDLIYLTLLFCLLQSDSIKNGALTGLASYYQRQAVGKALHMLHGVDRRCLPDGRPSVPTRWAKWRTTERRCDFEDGGNFRARPTTTVRTSS